MSNLLKVFPLIETERLILRKTTDQDWKEVLFLKTSKEVNKYIKSTLKAPTDEKDTKKFIKMVTDGFKNGDDINWSIDLKENNKMIGSICYWNISKDRKKGEVGYALMPEYHNLGYMTETLKATVKYGLEVLNFEVIEAFTQHQNEASKKLLSKCGFKLMKGEVDKANADNLIYRITTDA